MKKIQTYIKNYSEFLKENVSTEYYLDFSKDKFPNIIEITDPNKLKYKFIDSVLGSNSFTLRYSLEDNKESNPYKGSAPDLMVIEIGFSYKKDYESGKENCKSFVTIKGGSRVWWSFSFEDNERRDINDKEITLSNKSLNSIISILKKYCK